MSESKSWASTPNPTRLFPPEPGSLKGRLSLLPVAGVLSFICDHLCQLMLANFLSGKACFQDEMMLFLHFGILCFLRYESDSKWKGPHICLTK